MIISEDISVIGIQIEYAKEIITPHGIFNIIIDQDFIPGNNVFVDLYSVISFLKESLSDGLVRLERENAPEIGSTPLSKIDFSEETPCSLIYLDFGELSNKGFVFHLGFNGKYERLIYSLDSEQTYQEKIYQRGIMQNLIEAIPGCDELKSIRRNEMISLTDIRGM